MNWLLFLFTFLHLIPLQANLSITTDVGLGYRQDNLDWSIAGYNNEPNILSELKWRNITSCEISGVLALAYDCLYLRANADYGRIFSGHNRDSDYDENDRTAEFSRSRAVSDKGEVFDLSAGIGWQFPCGPFTCTPLVGWALDEQHLRDRKLVQIFDTDYPDYVGPVYGMNSNYRAKWEGPWLGADLSYQALCSLLLNGTFEYHWTDYNGTGHWNLRREFLRDFEHKSKGHGLLGSFAAEYFQNENLSFGLIGVYRKFTAQRGRDRKFILFQLRETDGSVIDIPVQLDTPLNGVHWKSYSLKAYVSYSF